MPAAIWTGLRIAFVMTGVVPTAVQAAEPTAPSALAISQEQEGAYVVDRVSHLAWPRCVEGMQWKGKTCTGTPVLLNRSEAMARATQHAQSEGVNWRLPSAGELRGLVKANAHAQGLNPAFFPPVALDWYWSVTVKVSKPSVNQYNYGNIMKGKVDDSARPMDALHGWAVNLATGEARSDVPRSTRLPVRLVLPQD